MYVCMVAPGGQKHPQGRGIAWFLSQGMRMFLSPGWVGATEPPEPLRQGARRTMNTLNSSFAKPRQAISNARGDGHIQ